MKGKPKGIKPDFTGVPGELVPIDGLQLSFGRGGRISPYDALLIKLSESAKGNALKFASVRAKASVAVRSKKLGFRVSFAELGGALYVRYEGRIDEDIRAQRRTAITAVLKKHGPQSSIAISTLLRGAGDTSLNAGDIELIVLQMLKDGTVLRQEGNMWALNPRAKVATV